MEPHEIRQGILDAVSDLVGDFLHYDRKEDEELKPGMIQEAVRSGAVTVDDIVRAFREDLEVGLGDG